jgi:fumarate reductase subunit C
LVSIIATLVLSIGFPAIFFITTGIVSQLSPLFQDNEESYYVFQDKCLIGAWIINGALVGFSFIVMFLYRNRAYNSVKMIGERNENADLLALGKHYFNDQLLGIISAPLLIVTAFIFLINGFSPINIIPTQTGALLLLANWFTMVPSGMYSMIDGRKKWEQAGQLFSSTKGKVGMQHLHKSYTSGLAVFIIAHYALVYLVFLAIFGGMCTGGGSTSSAVCSGLAIVDWMHFPMVILCGIMTLFSVINHVKGFFRVGNALIELENDKIALSPRDTNNNHQSKVDTYSTPNYVRTSLESGYQHSTWNAPGYRVMIQPMQLVEPVARYSDGDATKARVSPRIQMRCDGCRAILPEAEDVAFCPYCGARV